MLATRPLLSVSSDMTMMIFGEVPSFNLKANSLQQLENQINRLSSPRALFMTVWRLSTRSAENSCGIRQS